eukprot:TRINITY_DN14704_c0_g1_i1.p1 TRINITY_DN14704_c0_g1~~TRINITY_DN14704_c0_g1_i1.p1  ORF type:complete len:811 (-),score=189.15 TRINITY_DN14704_c0_g1_i1:54-2486(-)
MKGWVWLLVSLYLYSVCGRFTLKVEPPPQQDQIDAVKDLIRRLLGSEYVDMFGYTIIQPSKPDYDTFEIESLNNIIQLRGTTGVALASAFHWYLKYYAHCSVSWGVDGTGDNLKLPSPLPQVPTKVAMTSPVKYRYYMNVCTVSYSSAFWTWERWEREIDWMALHGYNLILSFTGQEYIEREVYKSFGLTDEDLNAQFSGPAFHAWERMGNIRGWGGPLDQDWINGQSLLQQKILQRQKSFGMISVLPGFAGHVPEGLTRVYPNANISRSAQWAGFTDPYCCDYLLAPIDPLFEKIGSAFIQKQMDTYGFTDHIYNADTFNEMRPASSDPVYLADTSLAVYKAMSSADPDAKWLMQGWLFYNEQDFWTPEAVKAYLGGVSNEDLLILDLYSDQNPVFPRVSSYYGKDFIWCMLHNFGGTRGVYGLIDKIATDPINTVQNTSYSMIGTGITMEAIEQNPVMYDLMSEMGWRSEFFDTSDWVKSYITSRYGSLEIPIIESSWDDFHRGAYSQGWDWALKSLVERRPSMSQTYVTSNVTLFLQAWRKYLEGRSEVLLDSNGPYHYDLVDMTRQVLANLFFDAYRMLIAAYQRKDLANTRVFGNKLLEIIDYSDNILATNPNYLLGRWLQSAKGWANNDSQSVLYEFNARNQISLWGPHGEINDYASKPWAGLYGDYYYSRWEMFTTTLAHSLQYDVPFDSDKFKAAVFEYEWSWNNDRSKYTTIATNTTITTALIIRNIFATSSSNYQVIQDTDAPLNDIIGALTTDVDQLKILCDLDSSCVGFNSNGWLKTNVSNREKSNGTFLYVKPQVRI